MPGKPVPASPRGASLARDRAEQKAVNEQLDRRIGRMGPPELLVHVGPDTPGRKVGRLWLRPRTDA